jgi:hypothetical protein
MISRSSAPAIAADAGALKRTAGTGGAGRTFPPEVARSTAPRSRNRTFPTKRAKTFNRTEGIQVSVATTLGTAPP